MMNACQQSLVKVRDAMLPLVTKELRVSLDSLSAQQIELHEALALELQHFEKTIDKLVSRIPGARITKSEVKVVITSAATLKSTINALQGKTLPAPRKTYRPHGPRYENDFQMDYQIG